jgi:metallo-beta-lactamase family protein
MQISFHGAARTVTGSKHLLTLDNGKKILLDCGMFQGLGHDTQKLNDHFGFNPSEVDVLLLSHAHIDHTGLIPKLVKEGFCGEIICTAATRDLSEILLFDSAEIQSFEIDFINRKREEKNLEPHQPLYTSEDVTECLKLFRTIDYNEWFSIPGEVEVMYTNAGHLVGSAAINLVIKEGGSEIRILFTGDVGRYQSVLLQSPAETPPANVIILESTYGDKRHDITFNTIETLQNWINKVCIQRKGQLIIPAFSVGRTQEILYALNQLSLEKRLPEIPVFINSPLSLKATETIKKYSEFFNERLQKVLAVDDDPFEFPGLRYVELAEESKQLVESNDPCVIISASGTADAGRVRHHIKNAISNKNNAILFAGYCGERSLGGQLINGSTEIEIFSETFNVAAEIGQLAGLSAHGDCDDLSKFLNSQEPEKTVVFLVHGEYSVQQAFATRLELKGFKNVIIPDQHQKILLTTGEKAEAA